MLILPSSVPLVVVFLLEPQDEARMAMRRNDERGYFILVYLTVNIRLILVGF